MQFILAVISLHIILGETFVPVAELPLYLELPARAMPVTYLISGMKYVVLGVGDATDLWVALGALCGFTVLSIGVAVVVVRRAG